MESTYTVILYSVAAITMLM